MTPSLSYEICVNVHCAVEEKAIKLNDKNAKSRSKTISDVAEDGKCSPGSGKK